MKVYSWNVLRSNKNIPKTCSFLESLNADVICLQEVTEPMLKELKKLPYHIAYSVERHAEIVRLFSKTKTEVNYAVILSRYEIRNRGEIVFPKLLRTFKSNVFEWFIERMNNWESISNLGAIYVDLEVEGEPTRVFSVHLALWNPQTRANEFEHLMNYLPQRGVTIVCGDLNILEYGPIKILNWLLGGELYEGMPWYPERLHMEERFKKYQLKNPLLGRVTHKFSRSQLDHILLSSSINVHEAWVESDSHGSDHQPVGIEVDLKPASR